MDGESNCIPRKPGSRVVWLAAAVCGILVCASGAALLIYTLLDLNSAEVVTALTPFAAVPLDSGGRPATTSMKVVIPDTAQWRRIRRQWGTPEYIISAVAPGRQVAYCLLDLKMEIKVYRNGKPIQTENSIPPYGYEARCNGSSLRFRAAPGDELRVDISRTAQQPVPSGDVIVICEWFATKDRLLSKDLNKEIFRPIAIAGIIFGVVFIALAVRLERRYRFSRLSHFPT